MKPAHTTPSQQIIADANAVEDIPDSTGRTLSVRRTTKLEVRRLMRACGAASDVDRWFGEAMLAVQVRAIDSVPVFFPSSADATDQLVAKLDNPGLLAVAQWAERDAEVSRPDPTS